MSQTDENSPTASEASNGQGRRPWRTLAGACRRATRGPVDGPGRILEHAVDACGAQRAFLAKLEADGPGVRESRARPDTPHSDPSRTVLLRALAADRSFFCLDVGADPALWAGESVRSLALRWVIAVPLDAPGAQREALVLDSCRPPELPARDLLELAESFGGLLRLSTSAESASPSDGASLAPPPGFELIGVTPVFRRLLRWIDRVGPSRLPVLIRGETGTGKEEVARALHLAGRCDERPFVAVNCTAFADSLLESELFGAVRGAYTGAERDRPGLFRIAHGGTLFLDEIGDMSPAMQAKLLRVVQQRRVRPVGGEREADVDVRILAATHRDLATEVTARRFRPDLYYRLAVLEARVPPLRERIRDLEPLIAALSARLVGETGCPVAPVSRCALARMRDHPWPGNIRELQTVLARAMVRTGGATIRAEDLEFPVLALTPDDEADAAVPLEKAMIESALRRNGGSMTRAALRIGWTRQKLYRRMRHHSIPARP